MITATVLSLIIGVAGFICIQLRLRANNRLSYRKALYIFIGVIFVALTVIGMPFTLQEYKSAYPESKIFYITVAAILQSAQNSFRTFVLDGSWSDFLPNTNSSINVPIFTSCVGLFLGIVAPLLLFSAILSMFKELTAKIRARLMIRSGKRLVLFSELNKDTIYLAEDIKRDKPKVNLIFTDVFPDEDEDNYELRERASRLRAVMLRTDISELKIKKRNNKTEYFIFGHDEKENIIQARKLFYKNMDRVQTEIYVRAFENGNALILDSLTSSLDYSGINPKGSLTYDEMKRRIRSGEIIRLRRIDISNQVARREIPKMKSVKDAVSSSYGEKETLSFLIIADTRLSFAFIKTLLWYCQSDKFKLVLNIVYSDNCNDINTAQSDSIDETVNVRNLIELECPDIINTNKSDVDGEAFYDIEFIQNSEFENIEFQNKLIETAGGKEISSGLINRIIKTDAVIVDRCTDGATLETAAFIRTTAERLGINPEIYAVCEDEEEILKDTSLSSSIVSHNDKSYNIQFIGKRSDTYIYDNIVNEYEENLGFCQHVKWVDVDYHDKNAEGDDTKEKMLIEALINYEKHEYFRSASVAKAKFLRNVLADPTRELAEDDACDEKNSLSTVNDNSLFETRLVFRDEYECKNAPKEPSDRWYCTCENCLVRRKLEHSRWNAYMRTEGYIPSPTGNIKEKNPMAKIHGNLVPFDSLGPDDREKDG